jgi:hypothetical protein
MNNPTIRRLGPELTQTARDPSNDPFAFQAQDRRKWRTAGIKVIPALAILLAASGGVTCRRAMPAPVPIFTPAEPASPEAAPSATEPPQFLAAAWEPASETPQEPQARGAIEERAPRAAEREAQARPWEYLVFTLTADPKLATDQMNQLAADRWEYLGLVNTAVPAVSNSQGPVVAGRDASILLRRRRIPLRVAGAIEGENLKVLATSGGFAYQPQDMSGSIQGQWSGDSQLFVKPLEVSAWVDLEIPAPAPGTYRLTAYLTRSWDYGVVQFLVNGARLGQPIDTFHPATVVSTGAMDLGEAELKEGANRLRVEVVATNPKSSPPHYSWGLDCVVLTRVR